MCHDDPASWNINLCLLFAWYTTTIQRTVHFWRYKTHKYMFKKLDDSLPGGNSFKLTWDVPAMSTPASRKLLNSCPNLLVALARSWVVPLDDWTTSLADWFRPAATSLRWAWTSWKLFPLDGNYVGKKKNSNTASSNIEKNIGYNWL